MKILFICNRFYPAIGGVETHVFNIARRFVDKKNSVDVICSDMVTIDSSKKFLDKSGEIEGIHFKRFRSFKIFGLDPATIIPYFPFYLLLNIKRYDIIHAHSYGYFSSWVPILICKLLNKKVIYTPHYADETLLPKIVKKTFDFLFAGWSFRMATKVIALTNIEKNILISKFRVNSEKITVIPNGINLEEYSSNFFSDKDKEVILKRNGIVNKNTNIITVSRIAKNKGHIYLLKAFKNILDCNLIIVGKDWGEKKKLENFIHENSLRQAFILENINDAEKHNLLKSSDIFVLPSLGGEAFGIVLLEAMAHGLPVIASDVGGVRDLVREGENGFLASPGNPNQIKEKIDFLLDGQKYLTMRNYCRKFAFQYDWDILHEKIIRLYHETLCQK